MNYIEILMKEAGITKKELLKATGLTQYRWEKFLQHKGRVSTIYKLEEFFDTAGNIGFNIAYFSKYHDVSEIFKAYDYETGKEFLILKAGNVTEYIDLDKKKKAIINNFRATKQEFN